MIGRMRILCIAALMLSVGLAVPARAKAPSRAERVARAMSRAHLTPRTARVLQVTGPRVLLGEIVDASRPESDAIPAYRVWSYDARRDAAQVVLARAAWAAWAGSDLLAVEGGALKLHAHGVTRTLLARAAPDFAVDPSGRWIAAVVRRPELSLDTDLVLIPEQGGPARPIAAFAGSSESRPLFTPDDRAVIFVSGRGGLASLWRAPIEGGPARQLTNVGLRAQGGRLPKGFVPPPPDVAAMHWEGAHTLVYTAAGRAVRVDAGGAR